MIKDIKRFIKFNDLDGYIIPKNDNYFTEYSKESNLAKVSNFTGSAGLILILKKKNYLFVDGRYTLQAKQQSGKNFDILEIPKFWPRDIAKIDNKKIGFNPKLFTENNLEKYFKNKVQLIPIEYNFGNIRKKKVNNFFLLNSSITGEDFTTKINKVIKFLKNNKINYIYVSASENVNWLLNIRGNDLPNSPIVNCKLVVTDDKKLFLFANHSKINYLKFKMFSNISFCEENKLFQILNNLKKKNFCIDENTCSIFEQKLIENKFNIVSNIDPIYELKSVKNNVEIKNTIKAHIEDGVALTKFLYWIKQNKRQLTEKKVEKRLEKFRRRSKNYLYPSFDTIAGSGPNGAIIHYKSSNLTNRKIKKNDILLIDSGGQYKWGTTDVTRTISFGKISNEIKNNFTRVLKGHIAVINCDIKKHFNGSLIDKLARKSLNDVGLNYAHGTGHGVGFFSNVHEGPQGITKYNKVALKAGMILSNEPGYYLKNRYGIRIENLIYIDKLKDDLVFKNLTFTPIDLDMINFKMLTNNERDYLFNYHLNVYSKLAKYMNKNEKKWLIGLIQ